MRRFYKIVMNKDRARKLVDLDIRHVAAVDRPANKREFLIVKSEKNDFAQAEKMEGKKMKTPTEIMQELEDAIIRRRDLPASLVNEAIAAARKGDPVLRELLNDYSRAKSAEVTAQLVQRYPVFEGGKYQTAKAEQAEITEAVELLAREIAHRDSITLQAARAKVFKEKPELYKRYRQAAEIGV